MAAEYSVEVCRELEARFSDARLYRPMRIDRYDAGAELVYDVTGVERADKGQVYLIVESFVGGGFAGQVYKVKILKIKADNGPICSLEVGGIYAMKIFIPPSRLSLLFRNLLYRLGFQGPFQLQVNPAAAMAGALWQKFIRRGAKIRFGDENTVADIYAMFVDGKLGSCGELSEWVEGRTWKLEVDDHLDLLKRWYDGLPVDKQQLGSPEYRAKRQFMADFVKLLYDMGAIEFARQYEWSTCKSQPNVLKRRDTEDNPEGGLATVDFRAGLALLPFLPMSPGDFKLIWKGLKRGSLVQFDRGDMNRLDAFVQAHSGQFKDMNRMLDRLKQAERIYRDSVPDITHNHIRLLESSDLQLTILDSAITGWQVRNITDDKSEQRLRANKVLALMFFTVGLVPFLGRFVRRIWARPDWRRHYLMLLTSSRYFWRAFQARLAEKVILWHRAGRVGESAAIKAAESSWRFLYHLPLSLLPAGLHRFLTDWQHAKERLSYLFVRPFRLYFNAELRTEWLREMVSEGRKKRMLSDEDATLIISQIKEPFIQKYLTSLVVHLLTLPVSEIVWVTVAGTYVLTHWGQPNAWSFGLGIVAAFQVVPISPGSLIRGFYVLYLIMREHNFKDYSIALPLGFFKYIGYLAFPIQMTYRYPVLARFMASHWATEAVHIVPVFGERGALLEHWVFCLFYNWPLTLRRRMHKRAQLRSVIRPRYWHTGLCAVAAAAALGIADAVYLVSAGRLPALKDIWWLAVLVPLACGAAVTLGAGGAALWKRIVASAVCGVMAGVLYTAASTMAGCDTAITAGHIAANCAWRVFIFAVLSTIGAIITELKLPDPDWGQSQQLATD